MNKKIVGILTFIAGILIIGGAFIDTQSPSKEKEINIKYDLTNVKTIYDCTNKDCTSNSEDFYADIKIDYDSKLLQDFISKENKRTNELYNISLNSNAKKNPLCMEKSEKHVHEERYRNRYNEYHDNNIISITVIRKKLNFCTGDIKKFEANGIIYDIKKDKIMNLDEKLNYLNITREELKAKINDSIKTLSKKENIELKNVELNDNIIIYITDDKSVVALYYVDELQLYNSIIIKEKALI